MTLASPCMMHSRLVKSWQTLKSPDAGEQPSVEGRTRTRTKLQRFQAAASSGSSLSNTASGRLCGQPEQQRSEEHTSELQSHSDIVCRLLLETKKNRYST